MKEIVTIPSIQKHKQNVEKTQLRRDIGYCGNFERWGYNSWI
jgi:hypothetical protein